MGCIHHKYFFLHNYHKDTPTEDKVMYNSYELVFAMITASSNNIKHHLHKR